MDYRDYVTATHAGALPTTHPQGDHMTDNPNNPPTRRLKVFFVTPCLSCGVFIETPQDMHPRMLDGEPICTPCAVSERADIEPSYRASMVGLVICDALHLAPVEGEA